MAVGGLSAHRLLLVGFRPSAVGLEFDVSPLVNCVM